MRWTWLLLIFFISTQALLAEENAYLKGKDLYYQKQYAYARTYLEKSKTEDLLLADFADYYIASSYLKEDNKSEALNKFTKFVKKHPNSALIQKATYYKLSGQYEIQGPGSMTTEQLLILAKEYWKEREHHKSGKVWYWLQANRPNNGHGQEIMRWLSRYETVVDRADLSKNLLEKLVELKGKFVASALYGLKQYDRILEEYPHSEFADDIRYPKGLNAYLDGNYELAREHFVKIIKDVPDGDFRPAALYWLAKIQQKNNQIDESHYTLSALCEDSPHSYWGLKAANILGVSPNKTILSEVSPKYNRLVALGCYMDAGLEINSAFQNDDENKVIVLPFWSDIQKISQEQDIDPYLVAAVMREESRYNPSAKSRTGAIGLMQLMPKTAAWLMRINKQKLVDPPELATPGLNLSLGTQYLKILQTKYFDDLASILAGYNAGPTAIARWKKKNPEITDEDEFIERIPYAETRLYVKKVLRSYWLYKAAV